MLEVWKEMEGRKAMVTPVPPRETDASARKPERVLVRAGLAYNAEAYLREGGDTEYIRADILSSRDNEIRDVLEGLSFLAGRKVRCWCVIPTTVPERHSPACLAARGLWERVQG